MKKNGGWIKSCTVAMFTVFVVVLGLSQAKAAAGAPSLAEKYINAGSKI